MTGIPHRSQIKMMESRVNLVEEEFHRQLVRLQSESENAALTIHEQRRHIRELERQLLEYEFRGEKVEIDSKKYGQRFSVHPSPGKAAVGSEPAPFEPTLSRKSCNCDELASQLLLEQETSHHLHENVATLHERLAAAFAKGRKAAQENEDLRKQLQLLEEKLEARKVLVIRLQDEIERSETRMKLVQQDHEDYKLFLAKRMGLVQSHLHRMRDDRAELLSSRPLLEAQVRTHFSAACLA
jgi:hypothetical protein